MKIFCVHLALLTLVGALHAQDSVSSLAGKAQVSGTNNGTGSGALFNDPTAIVVDASGNYFVADSQNHAIRKITVAGVVATFAGKLGVPGDNNGTGTGAQFDSPSGLAFDKTGNLFVSDTGNHTIRKITTGGGVSTLAGVAGTSGFLNGPTGSAQFNSPLGIAVATNGTIFVADSGNHCIRAIAGGNVTTFAGNPGNWGTANGTGTNAQFNTPCGLALDAQKNLFVSDANNHTIRKITTNGVVTTFAGAPGVDGTADGDRGSSRFRGPAELVFDRRGNLFIADSFNHTIRKISTNGMVSTVSGLSGVAGAVDGVSGDGRFFNPYGVALAADGSLAVADAYNELIRAVIIPFSVLLQKTGGNNSVIISWESVIGKVYQVQSRSAAGAGSWLNLGATITANSLNTSQTNNFSALGQEFYRVILVQ